MKEFNEIAEKIEESVFQQKMNWTLEEIEKKFAFDIKLPKKVTDYYTKEETWADSIHCGKYIKSQTSEEKDTKTGWFMPRKEIHSLQEILALWEEINLVTTERVFNSTSVFQSDTIYRCNQILKSTNCNDSSNLLFCDSCSDSEYLLASQRSYKCFFSIRTDDSANCSNSYNVICSSKISNSIFIQDCSDLEECMFCAHIANKKYCIANMQFEKEEYFYIKKQIIEWILKSV